MVSPSNSDVKISSRDQLVQALGCASELEHMLCLQYLFTAFSMRRTQEDFPPDTPEREWRMTLGASKSWIAQIYMIARQEMEHLGLATNLLSTIGAEPHFERPNFPVPADKTLVDVPMCLDRFGKISISRFIWYERPAYLTPDQLPRECFDCPSLQATDAGPAQPRCAGLEIDNIQVLYEQIQQAFQTLDPRDIFVGDPDRQLGNVFGYRIQMMAVQSADDAAQAVNRILEQGEGIGDDPLSSDAHFQRFTSILSELEDDGLLEPALPVVTNPATRTNEHGYPVSLIERPQTVEVMELFNECYHTMLVMLKSFFATHFNNYVPQPRCDAAMFYAAFFPLMTMVIRPLGEVICRMPAGGNYGDQHAGPSFELFEPLAIQTERKWYIERLKALARRTKRAVRCVESESLRRRMHYVYENLTSTYLHLDHIWRHGN